VTFENPAVVELVDTASKLRSFDQGTAASAFGARLGVREARGALELQVQILPAGPSENC
jgi:hypothetical protein